MDEEVAGRAPSELCAMARRDTDRQIETDRYDISSNSSSSGARRRTTVQDNTGNVEEKHSVDMVFVVGRVVTLVAVVGGSMCGWTNKILNLRASGLILSLPHTRDDAIHE